MGNTLNDQNKDNQVAITPLKRVAFQFVLTPYLERHTVSTSQGRLSQINRVMGVDDLDDG